MLTGLFGSRTIEKILLFLLINETGYGNQMQSLLGVPLTPVQKALQRLEKAQIVMSHFEGKTRLYQLNPNYPLRHELETLLKKAYLLLPAKEKKLFYYVYKPKIIQTSNEIQAFWDMLKTIRGLQFSVKSRHNLDLSTKTGKAEVICTSPDPNVLLFQEKGFWLTDSIPDTAFNNTLRWTLDSHTQLISLEHLRYGHANPVFLFHLTPTRPGLLESVDPHLCADDTYLGSIVWNPHSIHFHWKILGPQKNEDLVYKYTPASRRKND
jgi:hypothetical protein